MGRWTVSVGVLATLSGVVTIVNALVVIDRYFVCDLGSTLTLVLCYVANRYEDTKTVYMRVGNIDTSSSTRFARRALSS